MKSPPTNSFLLRERLSQLTQEPGVYKMLDAFGEVVYVGKAKNLKKRVSSYFLNRKGRDVKTLVLVSRIVDFQTIVTRTEDEALILERQLIRTLQPRYNIDLKDDKSYPYIKISTNEPFPRLWIVRERRQDKAKYFGPYPSLGSTRQMQRMLLDLFPLRDCKQAIPLEGNQPKCIKLDLGKCLGPCVIKSVKADYDHLVDDLSSFLKGNRQKLISNLEAQMWAASQEHRFEYAAKLRDIVQKLRTLLLKQVVQLSDTATIQVWGYVENDDFHYALVQNFVEGKLLYQNGFYEEKGLISGHDTDFFLRAILHFSDQKNPAWSDPKKIICDDHFLNSLTQTQSCEVILPKRGEQIAIMESAKRNAVLAISRLVAKTNTQVKQSQLLYEVQATLGLPHLPENIIGIDISHFQSSNIVGSAVYFKKGKPHKPSYRRFQIKMVTQKSNDPKSIYEVVLRRLKEVEEHPDQQPQLILIDGGKGQLNFAQEALQESGFQTIPMISLAKREEEIYFPNQRKPLKLGHHHPVLQLLQRVRDESHRFALTYQRKKRSQALKSYLEEINGLGEKRIKALYKTYRNLKNLGEVSPEELAKTLKISLPLATEIVNQVNQRNQEKQ